MNQPQSSEPSGLPHAIGAYLLWGLLPLYLIFVHDVPAFEFVGWRVIWTVPVCLVIVTALVVLVVILVDVRHRRHM